MQGYRTAVRVLLGLSITLTGCAEQNQGPTPSGSNVPPVGSSAATATSVGAGPTSQGSADGAHAPLSPHAGVWKGTYKAELGEVTIPDGVTYQSWKEDPGGFDGDNAIEITVSGTGVVSGKSTGSLGTLLVAGMAEDGMLRIGISPQNTADPKGMTGVLTGAVEEKRIRGALRVSSADASVVRKAQLTLDKQ